LTQLRTGHAPLNHHLHRIGAWETPFCVHCRTKRETVFHYIMSCEAYQDQRTQLRKEIPNTLFTFTNLISRKEYIPKLLEYVEQTDRLSHTF
ncbi:hypothetical protein M422DRAFT_103670, partial [Sphaerobolus stellatus SS14]